MGSILEFPVTSSNHVAKLTYDPLNGAFFIQFKNGSSETYEGVPSNVFARMTRAPSIGKFYHAVIKRHYKRIERDSGSSYNEPNDTQGSGEV